jgi:hypothetical protein
LYSYNVIACAATTLNEGGITNQKNTRFCVCFAFDLKLKRSRFCAEISAKNDETPSVFVRITGKHYRKRRLPELLSGVRTGWRIKIQGLHPIPA